MTAELRVPGSKNLDDVLPAFLAESPYRRARIDVVTMQKARITIHHDSRYPSRLILPLLTRAAGGGQRAEVPDR